MKLRNKKTGEIVDDGFVRATHDFQFDGQKHVLAVFKGNGHRPPERVSRAYTSLAELNEEWEDYKPTESLIKDEKIRKAVRAWAEAIKINGAKYDEFWRAFRFDNCTICFKGEYCFSELEDGKNYTIAELCGEEEE